MLGDSMGFCVLYMFVIINVVNLTVVDEGVRELIHLENGVALEECTVALLI
jgi:hypothetical protein